MGQNFCPNCGGELQYQEAEICPKCGVRIKEPPKPFLEKYAGFWVRFAAYLIDLLILLVIAVGIGFVLGILLYANLSSSYSVAYSGLFMGLFYLLFIPVIWLYYAIQESSSSQATIGKRVLNLKVTDLEGNRIGFGKATVRTIVKHIPIIGPIGCLIIGFSDNKQGLHDFVAGTTVLNNG